MLFKSFFTVSSFTMLSRISGFIRDIFIARFMGAGILAESFFIAFKLPNFFRRLFAEGAFNAAFVPIFAKKLEKDSIEAKRFAARIMGVMLGILLLVVLAFEILMPYIMYILAPGFADDPELFKTTVLLSRITFPYLLLISMVSLFAGILNSLGKFAAVAFVPILLNLCLISALYFIGDNFISYAHGLAVAVTIAGLVQLIWVYIYAARSGFALMPIFFGMKKQVSHFFKKLLPGIIGAGGVQINLWIDTIIVSFIPSGVAYLYYADRLHQLPLSIIGTAMGTALLPMMAKAVANKDKAHLFASQSKGFKIIMLLALPSMVGLWCMGDMVMSLLFERGKFDETARISASWALLFYAAGLPAYMLIKLFTNCFFAHGDTKTPVKIVFIGMIINIIVGVVAVVILYHLNWQPHVGMAIATAFSAIVNALMLFVIGVRKNMIKLELTNSYILKLIIASMVMGLIVGISGYFLRPMFFEADLWLKIGIVAGMVMAGMVSYFGSCYCFGVLSVIYKKPTTQ